MDTSLLLLEQSDLIFEPRGLLDLDLPTFEHVNFSDPYSSPSSCSSDYNSSSEDVDALIWDNIPEIKAEKELDSIENTLNTLVSSSRPQQQQHVQQQQKPTIFIKEDPAREISVPLNIPIIPMTNNNTISQQQTSNSTRSVDVTLYQKKRGSGGVWQPITQNERIRVDKNKGKLIKVILKETGVVPNCGSSSGSSGSINWTDINTKVQLALLDLAHPDLSAARERDGFTIEKPPRAPRNTSENCSSKEITLKLTKICKSQMFSVTVQTLDGQIFTGRSVQFRSDDNGKVQNANKKRKRTAPLENPAFLKEVIQQCLMAYSMNLPSEAQVAIANSSNNNNNNGSCNNNNNNNQQNDLANLLTRSLFPVMLHTINVLSNNNNNNNNSNNNGSSYGSNDTISNADCLAIASAAAAAAAAHPFTNVVNNTNNINNSSSSFTMTSTTPSSYSSSFKTTVRV